MKFWQNNLLPYDGEAFLLKKYINVSKSQKYFEDIKQEVRWNEQKIFVYGKWHEQARKVAWHGDRFLEYKYSGLKLVSDGWTNTLKLVQQEIKRDLGLSFNSVLVNLYRNGNDYMSYHQDNEKELGRNPVIASLSMGEARDFLFKHNRTKEVVQLLLEDGDLLIMQGETQYYWKHSIPKRKKIQSERLNLTFRNIISC